MNYQTQMTPITVEILQSLLYNAEKDITKIKLKIEFDDQSKYKRFMNRFNPAKNQDQQILSSSDSEFEDDQIQEKEIKASSEKSLNTQEVMFVQKLARLQLSIILKENYQNAIKEIQKKYNVRILVVPQKIKYFGNSQEDIQQAKYQVYESIRSKIIINSLQKYGKQIYESQFYLKELNQQKVHMGKLADKYYYWWDETKIDKDIVQPMIEKIFKNKVHLFIPLLEVYQHLKRRYNNKYIDAIIKTNAKLYTQYLQNEINDDKLSNHKVQLNKNKTQIIVHLQAQDQAEMIKHEIKKFFSNFIQFFIHYKTQQNQKIQNIDEIQKLLNEKGFYWEKHQDLIVLCFDIKNVNKPNQSIVNITTVVQNREKEFVENLKPIFELNRNCCIQYIEQENYNNEQELCEDKNIAFHKKISSQYKRYDGIQVLTPKSQRVQLFVQIIQELVLKPKLAKLLQKKKIDKTMHVTEIMGDNTISGSYINDTTSIIQNQLTNINNQPKLEKQENSNISFLKPILNQVKQNVVFKNYNFYIEDDQRQKKYDDIEVPKKKAAKDSQVLHDKMFEKTKRHYKFYPVSIPQRMKADISNKNEIITVFIKQSQTKQFEKDSINAYLVIDSKVLDNNGWLINVSKSDIKEKDFKYEIAKGTYQIIKYVKYLK